MPRPKKLSRNMSPNDGTPRANVAGISQPKRRNRLAHSIAVALYTGSVTHDRNARVAPKAGPSVAAATAAMAIAAFHPASMANPLDGVVTAGSASIGHTTPTRIDINQQSDRAIIDWREFNVGAREHTNFNQPSSSSVTLNRVRGPGASAIDGRMTANGNVFIVNRQGVVFGQGAQVSVGGLVATTSDIANEDFMRGRHEFSTPSTHAGANVTNRGRIEVDEGGNVVLAAPSVHNDGEIVARLGTVTLSGGTRFSVDMEGDGLLSFDVGSEVESAPLDADGNAADALVSNAGRIAAEGGVVTLSASARDAVVDRVINMNGVIEATAVEVRGGTVVLSGGDYGTVAVSGTIDASGGAAEQAGGDVKVLGERVGVFAGADINVDGGAGGGAVLIGGSFQGEGLEPSARAAYVSSQASVHADALDEGDGGTVVVWSDELTRAHGTLAARGGPSGGDGGLVETSSKGVLDVAGVDVRAEAPAGAAGEWLLDPGNIRIIDDGPSSTPVTSGGGDGEDVFSSQNINADTFIEARDIENRLNAGTSVRVVAVGFADVPQVIVAGDILVGAAIDKTQGGDAQLSLIAAGDITINNNITSTSGALNLLLEAGTNVTINSNVVQVLGGNINVSGSIDLAGASPSTVLLQAKRNINVDGGEGGINFRSTAAPMNLTMQAAENIQLNSATIQTNGGALHLEASSPHFGLSTGVRVGRLSTSLSAIDTSGGAIDLIGTDFVIGSRAINAGAGSINVASTIVDQTLTLGGTQGEDIGRLQNSEIAQLLTNGTVVLGLATTAGTDGSGPTGPGARELRASAWTMESVNLTAGTTRVVAANDITVSADVSQAANSAGAATRSVALEAGQNVVFAGSNGSFPGVSTLGGDITARAAAGTVLRPGAMTTSGGRVLLTAGVDVNTASAATNTGGGGYTVVAGRNVQLLGPVTTSGGPFDLTAGMDINTVNAEISTVGGAVVARAARNVLLNGAVNTAGGNISVIADEGRGGGIAVLQSAFQATPGSLTSGGGAVSISAERITIDGGEGAGSAAFINAGGGAVTLAAVDSPVTQAVFPDVVINGNVASTGGALLVNSGIGGNVTIGGARPATVTELTLDTLDLANVARDFSSLEVGLLNGTGRITLRDVALGFGITARANGVGGRVRILGDFLTQGPFIVNGPGSTMALNGSIVTAGQPITINDAIDLQGNSSLRTTGIDEGSNQPATQGANIAINGGISVDGGEGQTFGLGFDAGTAGAVSTQAISGVSALEATAGGGITFSGAVAAASFGAVATSGNIDIANPANDFTGTVTIQHTGAGSVQIADSNALQLVGSRFGDGGGTISSPSTFINGRLRSSGPVTVVGTGTTTVLNGDIVTSGQAINIRDAVELQTNVLLSTTAAGDSQLSEAPGGANITVTGAIGNAGSSGPFSLSFNAGTAGQVLAQGAVNGLSDVNVLGSAGAQFTGAVQVVGTFDVAASGGNIEVANAANDFTGTVTVQHTGSGSVQIADANALQFGASRFGDGGGTISSPSTFINGTLRSSGPVTIVGTGSTTVLRSDIVTSGQAIDIRDSVELQSNVSLSTTAAGDSQLSEVPAGANVTVTGAIGNAGASGPVLLVIDAGSTGQVLAQGAVSGLSQLSVIGSAGAQFAGAVQVGLFDVAASGGNIEVANVANDFTGRVTIQNSGAGSVQVADANALQLEASTLGSGAATLLASSVSFAGAVSGTGTLALEPLTLASDLTVGTTTSVSSLNPGFSAITLGRQGGSGTVTVQDTTFASPLTLRADGVGGRVVVNGALRNSSPVTIVGSGATTVLNGNILTSGQTIDIRDAVELQTNALLSTTAAGDSQLSAAPGGANITVTGAIGNAAGSGPFSLSFDAGTTGQVLAQGAVNGLSGVNVLGSAGAQFTGAVQVGTFDAVASGGNVEVANAGNDFTGAVTVQHTGAGSVQIAAANALQLDASRFGDGGGTISSPSTFVNGTLRSSGPVTIVGTGSTTVLSSDIVTSGQTIDIRDAVELQTNALLRTTAAGDSQLSAAPGGANITVTGAIGNAAGSGPFSLSFDAGTTGQVLAQGAVNGLSGVNVLGSAGAQFTGAVQVGTFDAVASGGNIEVANADNDFTGTVTVQQTGEGSVEIADANTLQLGASSFGDGNATISAGSLSFAGVTSGPGTGTLTLAPRALSTDLAIGSAAGFSNLGRGFSAVTLGRQGGTGTITVQNVNFAAPLTLLANGPGGTAVINGTLSASGPITIEGSGSTTTLNGRIVTAGQPITINDALNVPVGQSSGESESGTSLLDSTELGDNTGGANISVSGPVNGPGTLEVRAGSGGNVSFSSAVGATERLAGLNVGSAADVLFGSRFIADTSTINHTGSLTASTENALDVGSLFVNPRARGATLAGSVNGASGNDAALQVQGPSNDPSFTINNCIIGVPCDPPLPPVVDPIVTIEEPTPIETRETAAAEEAAAEARLPGVSITRLEQRYGLPDDPRDGQFSNFGNEELWLESEEAGDEDDAGTTVEQPESSG